MNFLKLAGYVAGEIYENDEEWNEKSIEELFDDAKKQCLKILKEIKQTEYEGE